MIISYVYHLFLYYHVLCLMHYYILLRITYYYVLHIIMYYNVLCIITCYVFCVLYYVFCIMYFVLWLMELWGTKSKRTQGNELCVTIGRWKSETLLLQRRYVHINGPYEIENDGAVSLPRNVHLVGSPRLNEKVLRLVEFHCVSFRVRGSTL